MATVTTSNGINLEFEVLGEARHPTVLMIMGLGAQLTFWPQSLCEGLAEAGYRVIRFDNRDVGLSQKIERTAAMSPARAMLAARLGRPVKAPYTLGDMAADALGLLEALGVGQAHVVGASMGGMIGQIMAATRPDRILSLTSIMSSSGDRNLPMPRPRALLRLLQRPRTSNKSVVVRHSMRTLSIIGSPGFPHPDTELREHLERNFDRCYYPAGFGRQLLAILASGSRVPLLSRIQSPTLVVHGADDPLVPLACGMHTAEHIPGAELHVIEGMGHNLPPTLVPVLLERMVPHLREADGLCPPPLADGIRLQHHDSGLLT